MFPTSETSSIIRSNCDLTSVAGRMLHFDVGDYRTLTLEFWGNVRKQWYEEYVIGLTTAVLKQTWKHLNNEGSHPIGVNMRDNLLGC